MDISNDQIKLSIILPCRNEEQALGLCLKKIQEIIALNKLEAEIIVSDSSTDNSPQIAREFGVRLIKHDQDGYGRAYLEAFKEAKGQYIFMADADHTYDFSEIPEFLKHLENGYDLVIGNRFAKKLQPGAMSWSHQYLGNPLLSGLFRLFFKTPITDVHSGLRAINKNFLDQLNLKTTGMEFASEMLIKAIRNRARIKELPIDYHPRLGLSTLQTFTDGWRHLRFMLLYSPLFLFFLPGLLMLILGLLILGLIYFEALNIFGFHFQYHPMFIGSLLVITGYQLIIFALFAKTYALTNLNENYPLMTKLHQYLTIEKVSLLGLGIGLIGFLIYLMIFLKWWNNDFGPLNEIKNSIIALTLITIGLQTISSSFMLSILGIKEK